MTDLGTTGDQPDTFDGRLEGIARLIDTLADELDVGRRLKRRVAIIRLLDDLADLASERIAAQSDRLDQL